MNDSDFLQQNGKKYEGDPLNFLFNLEFHLKGILLKFVS